MLKETLTYTDFNGTKRTEDFFFHITEKEALTINAKFGGDLETYVTNLSVDQDPERMIEFIDFMLLTSYGRKSADGRRFEKSEQIKMEFEQSVAYSDLFMKFLQNPEFAANFGAGLVEGSRGDRSDQKPEDENAVKVIEMHPSETPQ